VKLERITNILVLLAAMAVIVRVGASFHILSPAHRPASSYPKGSVIKDTAELGFHLAPRTLLLFTRSGCTYCARSMPFYRRLTEEAAAHGVRVIGLTEEELDTNRRFLSSNDLHFDRVVSAINNSFTLSATPTVLVVSRSGAVIDSWVGLLAPAQEQNALDAVLRSTT
jgi:peroxiredoxin